ncbi:hypothetical protein U1Q18_052773 [Sarracenia purpurea var. burkii]
MEKILVSRHREFVIDAERPTDQATSVMVLLRFAFKCGKSGHIAPVCRNNGEQPLQRSSTNGLAQGKSGKQRQNLGRLENMTQWRVFALTQEEADATPSVVQGTIFISNIPIGVLFDSGATHFFASPKFLHQIPDGLESLNTSLSMATSVGETMLLNHKTHSTNTRSVIQINELVQNHKYEKRINK